MTDPQAPDRRILIALAHPDDESFGMAGTIARYIAEGAGVYLICSTNGDVGTVDDEYMQGHETIADLRLSELQCAAQTLGLSELYTFGYRDSGMPNTEDNRHPRALVAAPLEEVVERITSIIREVRPQVVITFDPYGGYGHPDHIRMYEATTEAFTAAGDAERFPQHGQPFSPQRLYYMTFPRGFVKWGIRFMRLIGRDPAKFGRNEDIDLTEIAAHEYPIHTRINYAGHQDTARRAADCHASQMGPPSIFQRVLRLFQRPVDTYMRAHPPVNGTNPQERDFFEGLARE